MLLQLQAIRKTFGGVAALRRGDLTVDAGQIQFLLGENGAGKSTLMRIASGLHQPDGGQLLWNGEPVRFRTPAEASARGIAMVHQEPLLAPHLSVAENLFLGHEPGVRWGFLRRRRMLADAARLLESFQLPLQPEWLVGKLSPSARQLVEIGRAIHRDANLLIFDEPTSSLSAADTAIVFRIVQQFRDRGAGVIYITHRLDELESLGGHVTILRDGETVHDAPLAALTRNEIVRHMVGRELGTYQRTRGLPGQELLRLESESLNFSLRAGEITGLAGLAGAGRTELCESLFGLRPLAKGAKLYRNGERIGIKSPQDAIGAGIALIPEDRLHQGLAAGLTIAHNLTLGPGRGRFSPAREQTLALSAMERLRIRAHSPRQAVAQLSGGNQQKVVIARWLQSQARIFLFDEPTRGIDVGAKFDVFQILEELAREGAAILLVSSELPELLQLADRILVLKSGRLTAELAAGTTQEEILGAAIQ